MSSFGRGMLSSLGGPNWLRARRRDAFKRLSAMELPTDAEEIWRYSRIGELDLDAYRPAVPEEPRPTAGPIPASLSQLVDSVGTRSGLAVVRNGSLVQCIGASSADEDGMTAGTIAEHSEGPELLSALGEAPDMFVEASNAFMVDALVLSIPKKVTADNPFVILNWLDEEGAASFPRTLVKVGEGGRASVVEVFASPDVQSLVVPVTELDVSDAASLSYLGIQMVGRRTWQVAYQASRVGRDASLHSFSIALGGYYARLRSDSRLIGQQGSTNLLAAYFGDGNQMHDFRTMQDHDAPRTTSDLLFKGAVTGQARSVYSGLIRVQKGAVGTNAFQTNRNLVLSEGAHADSVPNLDIQENDVRCSHASAVGPIDEDQRYYLESRGISSDVADKLIVLGFFDDILEREPLAGARRYLRDRVADKLR